jgi:hypothetical protein
MKQYTNQDQTAKLIELGFPESETSRDYNLDTDKSLVNCAYSIGELINFLPEWIRQRGGLEIIAESDGWLVMHGHDPFDPQRTKPEIIDALFEYLIKLKG